MMVENIENGKGKAGLTNGVLHLNDPKI